jgi:S-(hydroxymethyl)glutathione dehydrogenase/alcohol dehydrogenase
MISSTYGAILHKTKTDLIIDEIRLPNTLIAGQVLVEIHTSGICGAQINEIDAVKGPDKFLPHLLGHEGVGKVIETGPLVSHVTVDDNVILHWRKGLGLESQPYKYTWRNKTLNSGLVTTFSKHAVVSENRLTKIPDYKKLQYLPLLGCGLTTAFGAITREAKIVAGESLLILGIGGVGSLLLVAAKTLGAGVVVAIDKIADKEAASINLGADYFEPTIANDFINKINGKFGIDKFDIVIDTTGNPDIISTGYDLLNQNGRLVLVGVMPNNLKLEINTLGLNLGKKIIGSYGGQTNPSYDIPRLYSMIRSNKLDLSSLKFKSHKLIDINEAIDNVRNGDTGKQFISNFA